MYAIVFDFDLAMLERVRPISSAADSRSGVQAFLKKHGFTRHAAGMYFGDETINAVQCVLIVQKLAKTYPWFTPSVRDIRMLRIEESCDLMPALIGARADRTGTNVLNNAETVMRGLDPRIHLSSQDDGLPGQARQ